MSSCLNVKQRRCYKNQTDTEVLRVLKEERLWIAFYRPITDRLQNQSGTVGGVLNDDKFEISF